MSSLSAIQRCIDAITHFRSLFGDSNSPVSPNRNRRFSSCLNNVLFDSLLSECCYQKARCLFRCQRYNDVIAECDQGLGLRGDCLPLLRKRGETYCLLQMYEQVDSPFFSDCRA